LAHEPGAAAPTARRQQTTERLLDAAYAVFARVGLGAATIDQIVEEAGYTKGAFYSNFETKTELFERLASRETRRRLEKLREGEQLALGVLAGLEDRPRDERLKGETVDAIVAAFFELQYEEPEWLVIEQEMRLHAMRDPEFGERLTQHFDELGTELEHIVGSLAEAAGIRLVVGLRSTVETLVAIYTAGMLLHPTGPHREEMRGRVRDTMSAVLGAIVAWRD